MTAKEMQDHLTYLARRQIEVYLKLPETEVKDEQSYSLGWERGHLTGISEGLEWAARIIETNERAE